MRSLTALGAVLAGTVARPMAAQRASVGLELGASTLRYADSITASAAVLAPSIQLRARALTVAAAGAISRLGDGALASQGTLAGSLFTPVVGRVRGELLGAAGGSVQGGDQTSQLFTEGRLHVGAAHGGAWGGGGGGSAWDGEAWRGIAVATVGAWVERGSVAATATTTPTRMAGGVRYTDVTGSLRWTTRWTSLDGSLGVRGGAAGAAARTDIAPGARSWGGVSGAVWVTPRVAAVAAVGSYPVDFTQGFPGGRYASLGLRVASLAAPHRERRTTRTAAVAAGRDGTGPAPGRGATGAASLAVRPVAGGWLVRVRAPGAARVELMGRFTDWEPTTLVPVADGWWETTAPIPAGVHRLNVRLDGGSWQVPAGLTAVADEFNGAVGILVVE